MAHSVFIRGVPQQPTVNVRDQPTSTGALLFTMPINALATCSEVRPDAKNANFQGQTYLWLFLTFIDGRKGWVRNDLLDLQGDCTAFGYGTYAARTYAFTATFKAPATPPTPAVPATPTVPATPAASTGTTTPAASTPAIPPTPVVPPTPAVSECDATVRPDIQARIRSLPSLMGTQVAMLNPSTPVRVLEVVPGQDGQPFRWVRVNVNGAAGFIREDLLNYNADCGPLGLPVAVVAPSVVPAGAPSTAANRFGTPVKGPYVVTQEFGVNRHKGADLGGATGLPIVASGNGVVAYIMTCTKCRPEAPNFASQGIPLGNPVAINDPAWGFGFGNHVVVRYAWNDLPNAARLALTQQSMVGVFAYVIHGHLSRIDIASGAPVSNGTPLGALGITGNASGPHLHLEVRLSFDANEKTIFNRVVIDPRTLYQL